MLSESQSRLIQSPPGEITPEQIAQWIPDRVTRNGGLRDLLSDMIWQRYCGAYPVSYSMLGRKYGVSRARIHQVVLQALQEMAKDSLDVIPPGTRLARAVERHRSSE